MGIRWDGTKFVDDIPGGLLNLDGAAGDDVQQTLLNVRALAARVEVLQAKMATVAAPALIEKLEHEGRITAADRPGIEKLVGVLGIEEATKFTETWPVKVTLATESDAYGAWRTHLDATAKRLGLSRSDAFARAAEENPALARAAFGATK